MYSLESLPVAGRNPGRRSCVSGGREMQVKTVNILFSAGDAGSMERRENVEGSVHRDGPEVFPQQADWCSEEPQHSPLSC
jgi:hypothetical protein